VPDHAQWLEDEYEEVYQMQDFTSEDRNSDNNSRIKSASDEQNQSSTSFTTMTTEQIANWIDIRSRVLFPVSFLIFNIAYWGFIFLDMALKNSTEET
jgi:hypothetical protein